MDIAKQLAPVIAEGLKAFYEDERNQQAFEKWLEQRRKQNGQDSGNGMGGVQND